VVGLLGAAVWFAPALVVLTPVRDLPLERAFAGIDGSISSSAAVWRWWGGIEYRDVTLRDRQGRPLVAVPRLVIDRGLARIMIAPRDLGTLRLVGGEAVVEVRRGGSTIEDVLAPWLAAAGQAGGARVSFELELVDAAVELVDLERNDAWRITDILAAGTVRPGATLAGWTVSGRTRYAGEPLRDLAMAANRLASDRARESAGPGGRPAETGTPPPASRLDRTTVAAGSTAILARDGGWSISSPDTTSTAARSLAVAATRLPLGVTSVAATRFDAPHVLDGLADVRLDITLPPTAPVSDDAAPHARPLATGIGVAGVVAASKLAICRSDTLAEIVTLDRGEMPLDLSVDGDRVTVRALKVTSRLFNAEASGRIRLPAGGSWDWAEALVAEDFAVAVDVDLAAAARSLPAGLRVRPDVRVTGGQLQVSAAARADGNDRVLEVRATSRDVAAVQSLAAARSQPPGAAENAQPPAGAAVEERLLRWNEPFTGWLRGRRGPARGDRLRIEEARLASPAVEVSAAGTADAAAVQWTVDLGALAVEAAEVLDVAGATLAGTARGRLDIERTADAATSRVKVAASLSEFELSRPGVGAWRDAELSLAAEGSGSVAGGALLVDQGQARLSSADDSLEVTLTGGAIVNPRLAWAAAGRGLPWLRAAPGAETLAADCSIEGDLARWQPRWALLFGPQSGCGDVEIAGRLKGSAVFTAQGDAWQITRAGGEVEKLAVTFAGRRISEPRVVATAAGRWNSATGAVEVSSAELLTATLSLRTGGLAVLPPVGNRPAAPAGDTIVERLRGKLQWQCDAARIERWLLPAAVADSWPLAGRGWGTAEILDTPIGLNVLVEATGSQLSLARRAAARAEAAGGTAAPLWSEPRATLLVEVTRPHGAAADGVTVNQLKLESSTAAIAAAGSIADWSTRRQVELGGTIAYDWEQVSRLATPWTGGKLRLTGAGSRPFRLRTPLQGLAAAGVGIAAAGENDRLPLPADWLPDAGRAVGPETVGRVTRPVSAGLRPAPGLAERLRAVSIDTSAAWTAADVAGFQIEPGEMAVRLFEGQLALGPFDLGTAGGRLRGAPWLRLLPPPGELIVPPGRCLDRVVLTRQLCERWVSWLVPLIGRSTQTQGLMSVDMAGARLPLADPFGGEASGQVIFENLEATPGEDIRPLVNLIVKLQSAIDPRFAFGDKAVLLRVRPEPVSFRLADRRLWHDGLAMDAGQLVIRSAGSVGMDGTLAMVVEVAFRGDIAGATPVVGQLLRTPLAIPLKGTVYRPQFDAQSIDTILGRIVENTAEAVIGPGLTRSLETLFGNPQPPAAPPPSAPGR
jgi:hypothetical protein